MPKYSEPSSLQEDYISLVVNAKQQFLLGMGRPSTEYTSDETPMVPLINIHTAFEQMRVLAHRALTANQPETVKTRPPRVLVLGPENSGKTSACKTWCNYAVRGRGWCPTLVNLDVAEGGWTVPGTISACPLSAAIPTCTPANPFGATATSAPTALSSSALLPVVYWFGHTDVKRNKQLMERLIHNLADSVKQKFKQDHTLNASGYIIDSPAAFAIPGPQMENRYNFVKTCVDAFDVNVILVMGNEKLNVEIQRMFGSSGNITILKVPKSGGVVELDYVYQSRVISSQIRAYFYGTPLYLPPSMNATMAQLGGEAATDMTLSPFSTTLDANELRIYRIGDTTLAPTSALPIGATRAIGEMQPVRVDVSSGGLLHSVLALLAPFDSDPSDEALLKQEVSGFLIVTAINMQQRKITVLSPSSGSLSGRVALAGSLEWQDRAAVDPNPGPPPPSTHHEPSASPLANSSRDTNSMYRSSSNENNVALIFSKSADFNPSIAEKSSTELSEVFLGSEPEEKDSKAKQSDIEAIREEIKESMYVVKLLEMIDTVLEYEAHLFSSSERELLRQIQTVDTVQQFLISRLVQRKRGKWHRADNLLSSYQRDFVKYLQISEADTPSRMAQALIALCTNWRTQQGPSFAAPSPKDIIDLTLDSDDEASDEKPSVADLPQPAPPSTSDSDSSACSFAEDTNVATPAELLECLTLDELKSLAKRSKITRTKQTRQELIKALLHSSSTQTTLPFTVVKKPPKASLQKDKTSIRRFFVQAPSSKMPLQERRVRDTCYEIFGACFRLRDEVFRVLHLVSIVYFRSTQYSESESIMLSAILATSQMRNYPLYDYRRTTDIFKTRADMIRYTDSLRLQGEIDDILGEGPAGWVAGVKYDRLEAARQVIGRWKQIWDRWNTLVTYFKDKPPCDRGLERFEDGHILTRIVSKAAHCFGLLKDYDMELKLREALVRQTRWRRGKRGGWYDRIALVYTRYMGGGDANLKKARDVLLEALGDKLVNIGSRPKLLKRLRKLEKQLRLPPEEHYASDLELRIATLTTIEGVRIFTPPFPPHTKDVTPDKNADGQKPLVPILDSKPRPAHKGKSVWLGKEGEVNVETLALEYYATLGFKGFHSEGSIISTLFGLLFWDILFAPVPGAFETPYQSAPLDLFHDSFVSAREDIVKARIKQLLEDEGAARRLIEAVDERERPNETWCIGVRWDQFEREALVEIVECLGGRALATICQLLAEEYAYRGGGVPDLFIWNYAEKTCKFVEVKGPGDQLSETQKVWIDVLLGAGVDVELCRVYELGKTPSAPTKKKKTQGRQVGRDRTSNLQRKSSDPDNGPKPDPESEEEDGSWSSSEDGHGVPQSDGQGTDVDQPTPLGHDSTPSDSKRNTRHGSTQTMNQEDDHPGTPPPPADTSILGKRDGQMIKLDVHQEVGRTSKRTKANKPIPVSTPAQRRSSHRSPKSRTPKDRVRLHTPTSNTTRQTHVPTSISTRRNIKSEPISPKTPGLTDGGPSLVGSEHTSRDVLAQDIVVPEAPLVPQQKRVAFSSPVVRPTTTHERWFSDPVTPIKRQREKSPASSAGVDLEPISKRKRADSLTEIATCRAPTPSTSSKAAPTDPSPCQADAVEPTITQNRTPRKRAGTLNSKGGVAGSPRDWEKNWPDVFPKWVGDLADKGSDEDYEPSQSQSQ
ncbi:mRNA cleavage and polyadenylation factor CLP1 [Ceratobasidium sp. AG-Ba]|nr:mRNA cleavage and polyadenylation factor CLP1 [Ceratobasidium sp. AG-Ba]